jgi:hypothetical protein
MTALNHVFVLRGYLTSMPHIAVSSASDAGNTAAVLEIAASGAHCSLPLVDFDCIGHSC